MSYFGRWWWVIRRWRWAVKPYQVLILVLVVMFLVGMCGRLYLHQQLMDAGY